MSGTKDMVGNVREKRPKTAPVKSSTRKKRVLPEIPKDKIPYLGKPRTAVPQSTKLSGTEKEAHVKNARIKSAGAKERKSIDRKTKAAVKKFDVTKKERDVQTNSAARVKSADSKGSKHRGSSNKEKVLRQLARPPSVNDSYYKKFERLERDGPDVNCSPNDTPGRIGSAKKERKSSSSLIDRQRRSQSAHTRTGSNRDSNDSDSFFTMAMEYEDLRGQKGDKKHEKQKKSDTHVTAVHRRAPRSTSAHVQTKPPLQTPSSGTRPKSGQTTRERSASKKRRDISPTGSRRSSHAGSVDSRKGSRRHRSRSRGRTLPKIPTCVDRARSRSRKTSPARKNSPLRKTSPSRINGRKESPSRSGRRTSPKRKEQEQKGRVPASRRVLSADALRNRLERNSRVSLHTRRSASTVRTDYYSIGRHPSTPTSTSTSVDCVVLKTVKFGNNIPKLKMVVVPSTTPVPKITRSFAVKENFPELRAAKRRVV